MTRLVLIESPYAGEVSRNLAYVRTAVYTDLGVSAGMKLGIARAVKACRPIEYRTLEGWGALD